MTDLVNDFLGYYNENMAALGLKTENPFYAAGADLSFAKAVLETAK